MKNLFFAPFLMTIFLFFGCENPTPTQTQNGAPQNIRIDPSTLYAKLPDTIRPIVDSSALEKAASQNKTTLLKPLSKRSSTHTITICTDINGGGTCATIDADVATDYNDLRYNNPWGNDAISSIYLDPGASIYLCSDINWGPPCYLVTTSVPDFRSFPANGTTINYNDDVSSFEFQTTGDGKMLQVWDASNRSGGSCELVFPFDYNYFPCGYNDKISSFQLNLSGVNPYEGGTFYGDASYSGRQFQVSQEFGVWVGDWFTNYVGDSVNNTFSSFKWYGD